MLFPALGNPGIDVEHYTLTLHYDQPRNEISATAHLDLVMTEDRDAFSLDSDGPDVSAVSVDGVPAEFVAAPPELLITPATPLDDGQHVDVDVTYTLSPEPVPSAAGDQVGWFPTPGGSYVLNEPEGARTWLPCDDHPSDKATFRFELTVPSGLTAVANGGLVDHTSTVSTDTWIWQEDREMATYMIQLLTGDYELVEGVGPNGLPLLSVVLHGDHERMQAYLDTIDDQIDFFDDFFGTYPLDRYGIAMTDSVPGSGDGDDGAFDVQSRRLLEWAARQRSGVVPLARARPSMVRRCGLAGPLDRCVAQRELRDVRRMDVDGPPRRAADR